MYLTSPPKNYKKPRKILKNKYNPAHHLTYGFQENKQKMILNLSQTISKSLTISTKHITNSKPIAMLGDEEVESQTKIKDVWMCLHCACLVVGETSL